MTAYDTAKTPTAAQAPLSEKISQLFGAKPVANAVAPAPDYVLTPDQDGKVTLAGYKVPVVVAVVGAAAVAALLLNRRTRLPVMAAATTAWGYLSKRASQPLV
jgi:hypothetical protein